MREIKEEIKQELKGNIGKIIGGNAIATLIRGTFGDLFAGHSTTEKVFFYTTSIKLNYALSIEKAGGGKYWVHGPFSYQLMPGGRAKLRNRNEVKGALVSVTSNEKEFSFSTFEEAKEKVYRVIEERKAQENRTWRELLDIDEMHELIKTKEEENKQLGIQLSEIKQNVEELREEDAKKLREKIGKIERTVYEAYEKDKTRIVNINQGIVTGGNAKVGDFSMKDIELQASIESPNK